MMVFRPAAMAGEGGASGLEATMGFGCRLRNFGKVRSDSQGDAEQKEVENNGVQAVVIASTT